mgnify:CR=1 FL=1
MGFFKEEPTDIERYIKENFNYDNEEDYNFEVEEEGEFVKIPSLNQEEEKDNGDSVFTEQQLPDK